MGVTGFVWYQLYMFLSVALEFGWLLFFFFCEFLQSVSCAAYSVGGGDSHWRGCGKSARPHQDAQFFFEPDFQRFMNASTHVENLSQSDKTDVANADVHEQHQPCCLPVLARAPVLCIFYRLCLEFNVSDFFGLEVEDAFFTHVLERGTNHVRYALKQQ